MKKMTLFTLTLSFTMAVFAQDNKACKGINSLKCAGSNARVATAGGATIGATAYAIGNQRQLSRYQYDRGVRVFSQKGDVSAISSVVQNASPSSKILVEVVHDGNGARGTLMMTKEQATWAIAQLHESHLTIASAHILRDGSETAKLVQKFTRRVKIGSIVAFASGLVFLKEAVQNSDEQKIASDSSIQVLSYQQALRNADGQTDGSGGAE